MKTNKITKTSYTPGPWKVENGDVIDQDGSNIADIMGADGSMSQAKGNARLIAAAPVLLSVLKDAYAQFAHNGEESDSDKMILDQMEKVIDQAEGRD